MACTYGESWALFHSDMNTPGQRNLPSTSAEHPVGGPSPFDSGLMAATPPAANSVSPALPDRDILAEVQRLQLELNELKRSHSSRAALDPAEVAQVPQQAFMAPNATDTLPNDAPSTSARGPRNNNANTSSLPRCWDPCCNGRTFSNQSNLARHQREKRGEAAKLRCSFCDAVFSRSNSRNAHEAEKRCRNNNNINNNINNNDKPDADK